MSQLPVLDMPDLVCVAAKDGWNAPGSGQSVFTSSSGLLDLHLFSNPTLKFDNGAAETGVDTTIGAPNASSRTRATPAFMTTCSSSY
jgi:hypothetical protein